MSQSIRRLTAVGALVVFCAVAVIADITRISGPTTVINWPVVLFDSAYDPTNQVHLAVWGPHTAGPARGQFLNPDGAALGTSFAVSSGSEWSGWTRVAFSEEYQTFFVAYTKILGAGSHQRTVRFLTYNGGTPSLGAEIPIANFAGAPGVDAGDVDYSPGANAFLVTWRQSEPGHLPESFVAAVSPAGAVGTRHLVSNPADGQSDPRIACDDSGRCLVAGWAWGILAGNTTSLWGRFVDGPDATPAGPSSFYIDSAPGTTAGEITVEYSPPTGNFLTAWTRGGQQIWSKTVSAADGALGAATLLKQSVNAAIDGGGYGFPNLVYNPSSQTMLLTMGNWWGSACAQEISAAGALVGVTDCVPVFGRDDSGFNVGVADRVNNRFLMLDNQNYAGIRSTTYSAGGSGGGGPVAPVIVTHPQSVTISSGSSTTLSVSATGDDLSYQWYGGTAPNTASPVGANASTYLTPLLAGVQNYWVKVTNSAGAVNSTTATVTATSGAAPTIVTPPASQTIVSGTSATLSVVAAGAGLSYQWYAGASPNEATPVGTSSSTYVTPALAGVQDYWVKVTNSFGVAKSATATVSATAVLPPIIVTHPQDETIPFGTSAILSVGATGGGLSYQWYGGTAPNTASPVGTDSSLYVTPLLAGVQKYWVRVSNAAGAVNSNTATISATAGPPVITAQPQSQTIPFATGTTLSVGVIGTGPFTYQWYGGTAPNTASPVGSNSSTYVTPLLAGAQNYWVRITNAAGMVNSATATVSATIGPPVITAQPQSQTIPFATGTTLSVGVVGTGPFTYQWYGGTAPNTASPVGSNSSSYMTPLLAGSQNYWVRITNGAGAVNSATVTVSATGGPPVIVVQPQSQTIPSGTSTTLSVTALGTGPLSYQWYAGTAPNTASPVGSNSSTYTTPLLAGLQNYWVRVTNGLGTASSQTVTVSALLPPPTPGSEQGPDRP